MTTSTPDGQNWDQYWSGRQGQDNESALVGVEKHVEIQEFWQSALSPLDRSRPCVDIACGAGTVARMLLELDFNDVHGADISASAIDILTKTYPRITGHVSKLEDLPFKDNALGLIVSQYGFEYGSVDAVVAEVARVLGGGGQFIVLAHKTNGAIHTEVSAQLNNVEFIKNTKFIEASRAMFTLAMTRDSQYTPEEVGKMIRPAQEQLAPIVKAREGLARHLYLNTQRMYKERNEYHYKDIMAWLDGMDNEINTFIGRMRDMCDAALNADDVANLYRQFQSLGFVCKPADILTDNIGGELGWILKASRT